MMTEAQKEARIARAKRHVAADMLIAGSYIEHGKGCSVGCDALEIEGHDPNGNYHAIAALLAKHEPAPIAKPDPVHAAIAAMQRQGVR